MKKSNFLQSLGAVALLLTTASAQAHTGHGTEGFAAGLSHPFMGLDHLLAMVAVGIWSMAILPKALRFAGPMVFIAMLLVGALTAMAGVLLPQVESGIAVSVAVLGAMLLMARRIGLVAGLTIVAVAAVFHGYAHGAELAAGHSFAAYAAGFMLGSAALHGAGFGAGVVLQRLPVWVGRSVAALLGASGLLMLATRL
ncbi:MAG: HupE/UreJ family protein [Gammaproteobacteria bacterium]|uniref:HupE/UreJ family protein n=1 Tax=Rhodoferax sp. TaxID=50421 RepID=UPI00182C5E8C|nr:HupE/UreJ family protein [Rhodoferax sp.]MBU3899464.1 HupE/UreJ family protein [Gammaproteobacteria bacterium]MBA3057236.1 HupE/UreJ family protein [Rhodoferax sp.]MBU3996368.1 HupE/UreJ family protein [Gammaproteobacteria bacterium]MBU4080719.1 HupE/UreJ family protein [Gammaproteobacteria bacterium]MBU4113491.1 HupE/UreJ family protein [Gammaproteobacteria bacterium]